MKKNIKHRYTRYNIKGVGEPGVPLSIIATSLEDLIGQYFYRAWGDAYWRFQESSIKHYDIIGNSIIVILDEGRYYFDLFSGSNW